MANGTSAQPESGCDSQPIHGQTFSVLSRATRSMALQFIIAYSSPIGARTGQSIVESGNKAGFCFGYLDVSASLPLKIKVHFPTPVNSSPLPRRYPSV